jgi:hypothetical protein
MDRLPYPVILSVSGVGLILIAIVVGFSSGSIIAALVVVGLAGVMLYIFSSFGTVSATQDRNNIDVNVDPIPGPNDSTQQGYALKEVFHIAANNYTFEEAPAVCAAYGAELASFDQLTEAVTKGAEWCGYGWSAAGMALYPTQQATWEAMQQNPRESARTACGHPGVNGGYFDPRMKFGVNCYGRKPPNMGTKLPQPLPGYDSERFNREVNRFKSMLTSIRLSPFNRSLWSNGGFFSSDPAPSSDPQSGPSPDPSGYRPILPGVPTPDPGYGPVPAHHKKPSNTPSEDESSAEYICRVFGIDCGTNANTDPGGPSASSHTRDIKKEIQKLDPSAKRQEILREAAAAGVPPPPDDASDEAIARWRKKNHIG